MILRRFTLHLKEQNWFAVGLDVIVVIVGIFLGMQVTEWNQYRLDRQLEKEYLERILDDLNTTIELQEFDLEFMQKNYDSYAFSLNVLLQGELKDSERAEFNRGLSMGGRANPIRYVQTAFLELQSTGNVRLIQNVELRKSLGELSSYHEFKLIQMEYPHQRLMHNRDVMERYFYTYRAEVGDYDFNELITSKEFLRAARFMQSSYNTIRVFHNSFNIETTKMKELIERYLSKLEVQ